MMFFIPPAILAIEDEDDRSFMENLLWCCFILPILKDAFFKICNIADLKWL